MSGGGGSESGGVGIEQPAALLDEQKQILGVQGELAQFQLRTLQQQQEAQRMFFSQAFPEESVVLFRREADALRDRARILTNKATGFKEGRNLAPLSPIAKAGFAALQGPEAVVKQQIASATGKGEVSGEINTRLMQQATDARLRKGQGIAGQLDNQANMLLKQADLLDTRADEIDAAPDHFRASFTQPLVSAEAAAGVGASIEADLASRSPLGPVKDDIQFGQLTGSLGGGVKDPNIESKKRAEELLKKIAEGRA